MFNNFILTTLTLQEAITMNEIANKIGLELSEMNGTFALFATSLDESITYQRPVAVGLESVVNKLAEEISAISEEVPLCETLYNYKRILRVIQMKIIKNIKEVV